MKRPLKTSFSLPLQNKKAIPFVMAMLFVSDMPTSKKGSWFLNYEDKATPEIIELCDWFTENYGLNTPFSNAVIKMHQVKGKVINYTDMMLIKHKILR